MQDNCQKIVCAVCGCYRPQTDATRQAYSAALFIPVQTEELVHEREFITHCQIGYIDYRLQPVGVHKTEVTLVKIQNTSVVAASQT